MDTHLPGLRNSHGVEPWGGGSWKESAVGGKATGVSCRLCVLCRACKAELLGVCQRPRGLSKLVVRTPGPETMQDGSRKQVEAGRAFRRLWR